MIPTPVTNALDVTIPTNATFHEYYGAATAYAAPALGVTAEGVALMYWVVGAYTGDHKLANQVLSERFPIVQGGHKLGPLVPHLQIAPAADDLLTPVQMLLSSWEVKFQNGEVQVQGSPIGSLLPFIMPGILCTDVISLPIGASPTNLFNSVRHYTSLVDLIAGWVEYAITALVEFLVFRGKVKQAGGLRVATGRRSASRFRREQMREMIDPFMPTKGSFTNAGGGLVSSVAGAGIRLLGREFFGYRGPISVSGGVGVGAFGGAGIEYTNNDDGSWSVAGRGSGPLGTVAAGGQIAGDAEGDRSVQGSWRALHHQEQSTWTRQEGSDAWARQDAVSDLRPDGQTTTSEPVRSSPPILDWL